MTHSYKQTEKALVRERMLGGAINALASGRPRTTIVREKELLETIAFALDTLKNAKLNEAVETELHMWLGGFSTFVRPKKPSDLKVLYLCGPEPLNDLEILLKYGVVPQNVWAVERVGPSLKSAVEALSNSYPSVRLHPGDLTDLFEVYPGRFDIVYYDALGSLFTKSVLNPLLSLFTEAKLEPVSALITNFANIANEQMEECAAAMSSYFRYRYNDLPQVLLDANRFDPEECKYDDEELQAYIGENPEPFYSDFITRFIADVAHSLIPNCRALGLRAIRETYLADNAALKQALDEAQRLPSEGTTIDTLLDDVGDVYLSPSSYPLFSFYKCLQESNHPFASKIGGIKFGGTELHKLFAPASILDKVVEGHWKALSPIMLKAIELSWFDVRFPFSCDAPLPNLLINSLFGIYGHPYFANVRRHDRVSYTAKSTKMFTDLFVFDQCRYFYDWFPTALLAPARFESHAFQVLARCILDRIGRNDHRSSSHPFRGAAVMGMSRRPSAKHFEFPERVSLADK